MPVGEIAGEALGGIFRFVARLFIELVFELLIQGTGHAILRTLRPHREPGDTESAVVGLLVWLRSRLVDSGSTSTQLRPNNSSKPTPLRGAA